MTIYHLTCPKCDTEFDFNYNQLMSISKHGIVFRFGPYSFSVKCPNCRKRSRYHVSDEDRVE